MNEEMLEAKRQRFLERKRKNERKRVAMTADNHEKLLQVLIQTNGKPKQKLKRAEIVEQTVQLIQRLKKENETGAQKLRELEEKISAFEEMRSKGIKIPSICSPVAGAQQFCPAPLIPTKSAPNIKGLDPGIDGKLPVKMVDEQKLMTMKNDTMVLPIPKPFPRMANVENLLAQQESEVLLKYEQAHKDERTEPGSQVSFSLYPNTNREQRPVPIPQDTSEERLRSAASRLVDLDGSSGHASVSSSQRQSMVGVTPFDDEHPRARRDEEQDYAAHSSARLSHLESSTSPRTTTALEERAEDLELLRLYQQRAERRRRIREEEERLFEERLADHRKGYSSIHQDEAPETIWLPYRREGDALICRADEMPHPRLGSRTAFGDEIRRLTISDTPVDSMRATLPSWRASRDDRRYDDRHDHEPLVPPRRPDEDVLTYRRRLRHELVATEGRIRDYEGLLLSRGDEY